MLFVSVAMSDRKRKGRDKRFYVQQAKMAKMGRTKLVPGIRGFLLFCNHRERDALREAYGVLNEAAEERFGKEGMEVKEGEEVEVKEEVSGEEDEDIEAAVAREKADLDRVRSRPAEERRFQAVDTGVQNLQFVRTTLSDPVALATDIMEGLRESGQQKTRNLMRLVPVQATCKATTEKLSAAAAEVLPKTFKDYSEKRSSSSTPLTFCVYFKARLSGGGITKEDAVEAVAGAIKTLDPVPQVKYKDPDVTVVVEVMKSNACLAAIPRYTELKKFNTIEIVQHEKEEDSAGKAVKVGKISEENTGNDNNEGKQELAT